MSVFLQRMVCDGGHKGRQSNRIEKTAYVLMKKVKKQFFKTGVSLFAVGLLSFSAVKSEAEEQRILQYQPFVANYLAAILAEHRDDMQQAVVFFERAESALGGDPGLLERVFSLNMANGNIDKAYEIAKELQEIEGTSPLSRLLTIVYDIDAGDYQQAYEKLTLSQKELPSVLQFHLAKAYLDIEMGRDVEEVITELKKGEYSKLLDGHKYYHIGKMYEKAGEVDKAIKAFELSFEEDDGSIFTVLELGRLYEQNDKRDMAHNVYRIFQHKNPESLLLKTTYDRFSRGEPAKVKPVPTVKEEMAEVLFGFSTLMVSQKLDMAGRQLLYMTTKMDPNHAFAHFYEGVLNEQVEDLEAAVESYEKVSKDNPAWLSSQVRVSRALRKMDKPDEALQKIETLLQDSPDELLLHKNAAEIYYETKQYDKAVKHYTFVIDNKDLGMTEASRSIYYFARGASYERLGDFNKASMDLEKSLEVNPNNPTVMNYLGYMWLDTGHKIDEAFGHIQKALLLRPNDGSIVDSMGWAYYKKQDYESAVQLLERAVELLPEDPTINMHLGDTYEKLGRMEEALLQWKRALELGPDTEDHIEYLRQKLKTLETAEK